MHYSHRLGLIAGALALTSVLAFADTAQAPASPAAPAAIKPIVVNGVTISPEQFEFLMKEMTNSGQQDSPELRENVRKQLISSIVLAQEAVKQGLDKTSDVATRLELSRQGILARAQVMAWLKANPVDEDKLKALYNEKKNEQTSHEVKARHILVKTEAEAKKVLAALKKGKKFEDLAKQYSMDPGSKENGGDLGWQNPATYVPEFSEALGKMEKGQITKIAIKTNFGYHIIQKQDERQNAPTLEQMKPQLQRELEGKMIEAYIDGLRNKADIK